MHQVHAPDVQSSFLADRHISSSIAVSRVISAMRQFRKISYPSDGVAMATKIQTKHKLTAVTEFKIYQTFSPSQPLQTCDVFRQIRIKLKTNCSSVDSPFQALDAGSFSNF